MSSSGITEVAKRILKRALYFAFPETADALNRRRHAFAGARREAREWQRRINDVLACPDNARLHRHPLAGTIRDGRQTMLNGLQVVADGYYGPIVTRMLELNRGSHEPQEELVFAEVLRQLPAGATMVELGAYWGFYSLWFTSRLPGGRAWLVEPEATNLEVGRRNFLINGLDAEFHLASVGAVSAAGEPEQICLDDFLAARGISQLDILHADIQGAELDMLRGARRSLSARTVRVIFISSHSEELHRDCVEFLRGCDYEVPVSVRPAQSYSFDGIIVAHAANALREPLPLPSLKKTDHG